MLKDNFKITKIFNILIIFCCWIYDNEKLHFGNSHINSVAKMRN